MQTILISSPQKLPVLLLHTLILLFIIRQLFGQETMGCLESDGRALLDFKTGLEDPENRLFSWKGTNCCQWKGIRCENNTGAVISVISITHIHTVLLAGMDSGTLVGK